MVSMAEQSASIVWFDLVERLGEIERQRLIESGLRPLPVRNITEAVTLAPSVESVVVRPLDDTSIIAELRKRFAQMLNRPVLVARIDRDRFELAVQAMRDGADNVIAADDFAVSTWKSKTRPAAVATADGREKTYVFTDPNSQTLLALAQRVARSDISVLVAGPTGVGKEVMARVLHESSPRNKAPFVALNCATLPESLIESILFGHEKGSFTGAAQSKAGLFEQANGGTLFLDEIGEMPYALQSKLLRVLQERELTRLGSSHTVKLDFRLVAATNRDLRAAIATREFREDLYFRVSAFRLTISPLADRPGDILPLAALFLVKHSQGVQPPMLSRDAGEALLAYRWPGNVRELENVMQRALVLRTGGTIELEHLVFDDLTSYSGVAASHRHEADMSMPYSAGHTAASGFGSFERPSFNPVASYPNAFAEEARHPPAALPQHAEEGLHSSVRATEYQAIMNAIRGSANRNEAAARLGISPRTLRYKLARLREPLHGGMAIASEGAA